MKKFFNCKHLSLELSGNKQVVGGLVLLNALVAVFAPVLLLVTLTASFLYFFRIVDHKNVTAKDLYTLSAVGKFLVLVLIQIILVVVVLGFVHQSAKISLLIAVLAAFLFSYVAVLVQSVFASVVVGGNSANDDSGLLAGPKAFSASNDKVVAGVKVSDVYSTVVVFLAVLALSTSAHGVSFVGFLALLVLLTELFNVTALTYKVLTSKEAVVAEAETLETTEAEAETSCKAKCGSCKVKCVVELVRKVFALFFNSIAGIFQFAYGLVDDLKEVKTYYKEERAAEKARLEAEFDKVVETAEQEGKVVAEKVEAVVTEVETEAKEAAEAVETEAKEAGVKFNGLSVDDTAAKGFVANVPEASNDEEKPKEK